MVRKYYIGCGSILLYMKQNKTPTLINMSDKLLINFVNDDGYIEVTDDIDPEVLMSLDSSKTISNLFLITLEDDICPCCNAKLTRNGTVDFNLNNTLIVKKQKYKCSNKKCKHCQRSLWEKYIEPGCNYTMKLKEFALELRFICNISYDKITEIIKLAKNIDIRRDTLFKFFKEEVPDFLSKKEKENLEELKKQDISFSEVLCYDEQYVLVDGKWKYRLTAMDPVSKWVYDTILIEKEDFTQERIKKFIQSIMDITPITTLVTDGSNKYPQIAKDLGLKHELCNFHKMQNYIDKIKRIHNNMKRKRTRLENKIETNTAKIEEIKEKRKHKVGRRKNTDSQANKLVEQKKKLTRENSEIRAEIRELNEKIKAYDIITDKLSLMLKSKSKQTGYNRYKQLLAKDKQIPDDILKFIKDIKKDLDKLLLHTTDKDIPTTNNIIELLFLTTLNYHNKRKYRTTEGITNEIRLKTIRWNRRIVLENN